MTTVEAVLPAAALRPDFRLRHPVVAATVLAAVLHVLWALFMASDAGDLAAQYAWTDFVLKHPDSAYNLSWYGGMHPANYSVLSPYVMGLLGVRTTAVISGTLSATLAAWLLVRSGIRRPMLPALWAAFAMWCDIASGRVTFALGMLFALLSAALLLGDGGKVRLQRVVTASALGALATMCSPVAGLFVEVLAAALFLNGRRKDAYVLAAGPPLVIGTTSLLFPFYGVQPFAWYSASLPFVTAVLVAVLVPRRWRTVRAGSWVYAVGIALCWVIPSPIGSNVERLALLLGGVVLLAAAQARKLSGQKVVAAYMAFSGVALWTIIKPVADFVTTAPATATVEHAQPLIDELLRVGADRSRVEVVPMRSHWEASGLAPHVNLARGWNRQADVERNPLFYNGTLTPASYIAWLRNWGVAYVVLPADKPDTAGVAEAKIVASGNSWLKPVWQDSHWRLYRVSGTQPLVDPPATVTLAGPADLTVKVPKAGSVLLRVPWSPWLGIDGALDDLHGCLAKDGEWTRLYVPTPGTYKIGARYSLTRGTPCQKPEK
ncbi:MFS transporter [Actinacidiphila oryziradicis]|uniref:MFS transporter n=1 Tax=Actinacidiphila oryziradicis TaxID=2571141 RepID=A0A4U0SQC5_9ACTN|nr:MFS transporter [Actinacidiphila oryziradicis]TKA12212.1 MFS transporter [Actinacidiphila oryziradicis]